MNEMIERHLAEIDVVQQAAEVANDAIGKTVMAALRSAQVCGCRRCKQAAGQATLWAVLMMEPGRPAAGSPDESPAQPR